MVRKVLTATLLPSVLTPLTKKALLVVEQRLFIGDVGKLLPILLDAGGAQAGQAMLIDRHLPAQELFGGQRVALTGFLEA